MPGTFLRLGLGLTLTAGLAAGFFSTPATAAPDATRAQTEQVDGLDEEKPGVLTLDELRNDPVPASYMAPGCSSSFCTADSTTANGAQCTMGGKTYTCSKCKSHSGADAAALFAGDLSAAAAEEKCETMYSGVYTWPVKKAREMERITE